MFTRLFRRFWEHASGLTADGTAYCWGKSTYGELGETTGGEVPRRSDHRAAL